ncbi:SHOCT domain-containing protein [Mycolicibacterium sp.]|uniref:SHOCT domain-containing protein n=1 Tax=Mycolicibacterium sp. TaxID=2320850 RepID=UPI003D0D4979
MNGGAGPRAAIIGAVGSLVVGVIGLIVTVVLNAFVFDEFNAYGEVPVPGQGRLALPAGEVTISFHTVVTGGIDGGFPVPALRLGLDAPAGVPDPVVTETTGSTTSVNNDVRVRIWVAQIPQEGVYDVVTDGDVGGYIDPRLAFGRDSSVSWLWWVFGGLLGLGILELVVALTWWSRSGRRARPLPSAATVSLDEPYWPGAVPPPVQGYQPTDHGVRMEALKTLAALRDSGALTEAEFQAEKRRILDGR